MLSKFPFGQYVCLKLYASMQNCVRTWLVFEDDDVLMYYIASKDPGRARMPSEGHLRVEYLSRLDQLGTKTSGRNVGLDALG